MSSVYNIFARVREFNYREVSVGVRRLRGLSIAPKFILLDEPFAGVDPIAVEDIQSIVIKLKEKNIGILITDHNVQETLCITDRAYLLYDGRILQSGSAEDLANDPEVRRVYLGKNFELRRKNKKRSNRFAFHEKQYICTVKIASGRGETGRRTRLRI